MRVISVDPGYDRIGVAVMELENGKEKVIYSSCIETDKKQSLYERLLFLGNEFISLINKYSPDSLAIENIFFNKNIKTAIGVAQARGMLLYIAQTNGCSVYEFGPQEIKIAVTGYGNSDKKSVIDMIKKLIESAPESALDDEYDAIAVGTTCLAHYARNK